MGIPLTLSQVPAVTPYIQYVATNGQTVFPYPFPITQDSDLVVVINGVTQPTDSGYTLSGQGNPTGGNLTFTLGQTAGAIITLFRNITIARLTQIAQNSGFSSTAFNAEFNNLYLIAQQLQESLGFALQIPNTNNPAPTTMLTPANVANKYLAFDVNGNPAPAVLTSSGSLTGSIIAGLFQPQTTIESNAGIVPANFFVPPYTATRYSGVVADGATDCTTALTTISSLAVPITIPYNVKFNRQTLITNMNNNAVFIDQSIFNDYNSAGYKSKRTAILTKDVAAYDSIFTIDSGHAPQFSLNNFGTSGSQSASSRLCTIGFNAGQFQLAGNQQFGDRLMGTLQFGQDSPAATFWSMHLQRYAPWTATAGNWDWWNTGQVISGAGVYRANGTNHYVSANGGTTNSPGPSHTSGTVADGGGVQWTWIDFYGAAFFSVDQWGRMLLGGAGGYTYTWNFNGNVLAPDTGSANMALSAQGASSNASLRLIPTTSGSVASPQPYFVAQDGVGTRVLKGDGSAEFMRWATNGAITYANSLLGNTATSTLGYATGAGGAVTQLTSRTTGVTLNTICGQITLFTAAGSATAATFTVTNSTVAAADTVLVSVKSGTNVYIAAVTAVAAGSFNITFYTTGGTVSDTPVFTFAVVKAAAA